ncbi:hypothetical protein DFJ77DRAFT_445665 [Powellomyces hirtus]|nr:hypothetical protein DFJ77DRAFT_445665 [Powellomyces hirtus]
MPVMTATAHMGQDVSGKTGAGGSNASRSGSGYYRRDAGSGGRRSRHTASRGGSLQSTGHASEGLFPPLQSWNMSPVAGVSSSSPLPATAAVAAGPFSGRGLRQQYALHPHPAYHHHHPHQDGPQTLRLPQIAVGNDYCMVNRSPNPLAVPKQQQQQKHHEVVVVGSGVDSATVNHQGPTRALHHTGPRSAGGGGGRTSTSTMLPPLQPNGKSALHGRNNVVQQPQMSPAPPPHIPQHHYYTQQHHIQIHVPPQQQQQLPPRPATLSSTTSSNSRPTTTTSTNTHRGTRSPHPPQEQPRKRRTGSPTSSNNYFHHHQQHHHNALPSHLEQRRKSSPRNIPRYTPDPLSLPPLNIDHHQHHHPHATNTTHALKLPDLVRRR